jgi:hypothetical protein
MTPFSEWQNFYVIMGSSAGALIGLQFVVITLIADLPLHPGSQQGTGAYATPTIVHFGAVLLLAGILCAPWHSALRAIVVWGTFGFIGLIYTAIVTRRMRTQTAYRPEVEDWLFHSILPLLAYAVLTGAAFGARIDLTEAMFAVAGAAMLLLFIGIHNAWDAVTYHVFTIRQKQAEEKKSR